MGFKNLRKNTDYVLITNATLLILKPAFKLLQTDVFLPQTPVKLPYQSAFYKHSSFINR
jgi:hypothetical protein